MKNNYISIWDNELLPKLKENYQESFDRWANHELLLIYQKNEKSFEQNKNNFKKEFNSFKYNFLKYIAVPLSIIALGIPYFFVKKQINPFNNQKKEFENIVKKYEVEKLRNNQLLLDNCDFFNLINYNYNSIGYKHCGPITNELLLELQDLSLFDFNDSNTINPYNTSWGIIDNKIIINLSLQTHKITQKTYYSGVGSATFDYPEIKTKTKSYVFMLSCSNLEFKYQAEHFGQLLKKQKSKLSNQSALENDIFEQKLEWIRNDEIQFRMIFTILAQENYINEILVSSKTKVFDEFKYQKEKSFFSNEYFRKSISLINSCEIDELKHKFMIDHSYNLENFKQNLYDLITNHLHDFYLSLNYLWIIPIFKSENHQNIIAKILNKKNKKPTIALIHYLLNEILQYKIIVKDTDTFHQVLNIENYLYENTYIATIKGLSYSARPEKVEIPLSINNEIKYYNINYTDYSPFFKIGYVFYAYVDINLFYLPKWNTTNIMNENILNIIYELNDLKMGVAIREGYLVIYSQDQSFNKGNISQLIGSLLNAIYEVK